MTTYDDRAVGRLHTYRTRLVSVVLRGDTASGRAYRGRSIRMIRDLDDVINLIFTDGSRLSLNAGAGSARMCVVNVGLALIGRVTI